ncbi:LacI family DNA-binding transcriptional regulator [Thermoflavimicrobium dichotomicum]|uniref:LacI family transcriptional regulator, repressor for deo operon, udp, cdd, tsx, nupC, and nupG n=1 Tax=Thermoflavimicrobium dichotomicum TaxID=46223 RepID=A0A1I3S735_9BACL|nr:LacI family DNA-binding transcriptional regulator [Thermoflavimicrobium dichotomicum]SFJ53377.1 LacI family transcriptional regulator, repressor for deo operon, udp, cdd, tsx, nupC, and nupG [Thermoflavimicrobium dichotomicum]
MAKMIDVAKLAGVSVATVSRVLMGKGKVREQTRQKVLEAIKQLNYKPNRLARNLRRLESQTVVVVIPDISNPFFTEIVLGIQEIANQHGYHVLLGNTNNDVKREIQFIEMVKEKVADGVILVTVRNPKERFLKLAQEFPIVFACEYIKGAELPMVTIDNVRSAQCVVNYLVNLGHRKIGYIGGPQQVIVSRDRLQGFIQGVIQNDIPFEPAYITEGDFGIQSGIEMATKLLQLPSPPTAIFAANDEMAIGAIKAIKNHGLSVPKDIAIVGFDNITMSTVVEPALTTISQPRRQIGQKAMELLLQLIHNPMLKREHIVLPYELVIRQSCGNPSVWSDS